MTIATKNNAIIVKDGKLAENCGCCGGWYCCAGVSLCPDILRVSVSISASDVTGIYTRAEASCESSPFFATVSRTAVNIHHLSALAGSHTLTRVSLINGVSVFRKDISSDSAGCSGASVNVTVYGTSGFDFFLTSYEYHWQQQVLSATPPAPLPISQMLCSPSGSAPDNCSAQAAYSRAAMSPSTRLGIPLVSSCIPESQTIEVRAASFVSQPFFNTNAGDGSSTRITGGTASTTYAGFGDIVSQITISIA
jgi:hypothetical protein